MVPVLLGLRFVLELALLAAIAVLGAGWAGTPLLGWVLALGMVVVAAAIWGTVLSPRRRIDPPLSARVGLELVLFGLVALGLALSGRVMTAWVLLTCEVVVLAALWLLGMPPGTGAAASGAADRGPAPQV